MFCLVLIGILLSASAVTAAHDDVTEMCAQREVDLIFILALPSSVDGEEMMLLKNAVVNIVEALPLDQVKVAVVTFANNSEIAFDFNDYADQSALVDAINAIQRPDDPPSPLRRTEATPALVMALENDADKGHRPNATVVTLLITDGPTNDLDQLAGILAGIGEEEVHVMQVGDSITSEELDILTLGVTDRQYQVDSYCDLIYAEYLPKYLYCSCNPSCVRGRCDENDCCICPEGWVGPDCNALPTCAPRDFVFVMDCSKSIKNNDFDLLKDFMADVFNSSNFPIGKGEYHVGMIKYGYDVETEFKMLEIFDRKTLVQRAVDLERPQRFKGTRTTRAMTAALKMFQEEGRDIDKVAPTMIVITDGKATDDKGGSLDRIIHNVSEAGIVTFVVTISINEDNRDEVTRIAGDLSQVLSVEDFANLDEIVDIITENLCDDPEVPTTCTPECQNGGSCVNLTCQCASGWTGQDCGTPICDPCCLRGNCTEDGCECPEGWTGDDCGTPECLKRNTVLVLDSSDSLTDSDFQLLIEFVTRFLTTLAQIIDGGDMRFAAVKYGYEVVVEFNFTFPQTSEALIAKVNATERPDGSHGTRTVAALRKALRIIKTDDLWKDDSYVPSIILVSDGKSTDDKDGSLQRVVDRMDKDNISRYCIGIGNDIDETELELIAGDPNKVFLVKDFEDLVTEAEEAAEQFCDTK